VSPARNSGRFARTSLYSFSINFIRSLIVSLFQKWSANIGEFPVITQRQIIIYRSGPKRSGLL
jgi:hypothetical protein